ncbi:MAG: acyl-CoA thioesterase, partial [Rhodobacteraceae bacterium]|nr:acyl-CoA thioesterase [Paracoccaceae bacterium]
VATETLRYRKAPRLGLFDTHVTTLTCWPWDIDVFLEMNNGRTLTLYDLGRFGLFQRIGTVEMMRNQKWSAAIAGASIRYRKRVRAFQRIEVRTRMVGWDARFVYVEQSMWRKGECTSHTLMRSAITDSNGIVPTERVAAAMGIEESPPLPDWVQNWIEAEATRPWPPKQN